MAMEPGEVAATNGRRADVASDPHPRRRGTRGVLSVPLAVVSTLAVTLGIAQPAEAAPQPVKRHAKSKAQERNAVPAAGDVVASAPPSEYVVVDGDTVSGVAERFGLATAEVLAFNGLGWSSLIFPGQRLALPGGAATESAAPAPPPVPEITKHVVVEGDTVSGIAAAYGLDVASVLSANGLGPSSLIFPGESIVLPLPGTPAVAPPPAAPAPAPAPPAVTVASVDMPLTDEMRGNARIIVDVGRALGVPDQGIVVALAAAAQESGLRNLRHGDLDSLGLFQQRPSQGWGTIDEVLDPVRAATAFYGGAANPNPGRTIGLLDIAGWEAMSLDRAAQAVQRSAYPGHYAKWDVAARAWLSELG
ncbi:LysM peptidoglycan-binding domain-containing protein [Agromyces sp. NPDC058484]|uniref:LysM peptidoglycan-binding domain-containing protein n=1 Tax=Agromyces sp. NPDC058484 TaxID=3346524 RepID=UPI003665E623